MNGTEIVVGDDVHKLQTINRLTDFPVSFFRFFPLIRRVTIIPSFGINQSLIKYKNSLRHLPSCHFSLINIRKDPSKISNTAIAKNNAPKKNLNS